MSTAPHLVSAGRSHPCVPPLAAGVTQHAVVDGRCTRCGTTMEMHSHPREVRRAPRFGDRVLGIVLGSGALALGVAYLLIAAERLQNGGSLLSPPAFVGTGVILLGGALVVRAFRG